MSDQGRVRWLPSSRWTRTGPPPPAPPGIAVPAGSPFAARPSPTVPPAPPMSLLGRGLARAVQVAALSWALSSLAVAAVAFAALSAHQGWVDVAIDSARWQDADKVLADASRISNAIGVLVLAAVIARHWQRSRSRARPDRRDAPWFWPALAGSVVTLLGTSSTGSGELDRSFATVTLGYVLTVVGRVAIVVAAALLARATPATARR